MPRSPVTPPLAPSRIALTGGSGFVGRYAAAFLAARGAQVRLLAREGHKGAPQGLSSGENATEIVAVGDLAAPGVDLAEALRGTSALIHLAARAHRTVGEGEAALALYRSVNTAPSLALAQAAVQAGVHHMIFVSTAYVHGHATSIGQPLRPDDPLAPEGAYAVSKAEAETTLRAFAAESGLALSIIRPPLIHGPGAKVNMQALAAMVRRGLPLPLGSARNRRSLLGLENLSSFLRHRLQHPPQPGTTEAFLLADAEAVSTARLIRLMAQAQGRPARLLPFPPALLRAGLTLIGKSGMAESLLGSFEIDIGASLATGWQPPLTLAEGLKQMLDADA